MDQVCQEWAQGSVPLSNAFTPHSCIQDRFIKTQPCPIMFGLAVASPTSRPPRNTKYPECHRELWLFREALVASGGVVQPSFNFRWH